MYSPLGKTTKSIWPLVAICCLFTIGFIIAATIILALIPIYLPRKTATLANLTSTDDNFYLQYSADVPYASSVTGTITNLDQVSNSLGVSGSGDVTNGIAQAAIKRRKRGLGYRRHKRTLQTNFLFIIALKYSVGCSSSKCRRTERTKLRTKLSSKTRVTEFSCTIRSGGKPLQLSFNLDYVGIISTKPVGFAGESSTFQFVAIKSGAFNDPTIWADGIVPYGNCSVAIVAGIVVSLPRPKMEIRMRQCEVYGSLALGEGSSTFEFDFSTNIIVRSGGSIQDSTSSKRFLIPSNSILTVLNGGSFGVPGTVIQTTVSGVAGASITLSSAAGPLTCGLLPDGTMQSYNSIVFIAIRSSGFTSGETFLGGLPPSAEICSSGCGIQIQSGVTLSTADLLGVMSLQITSINVPSSATLQLGTPGSSNGFRFSSSVTLSVSGSLSFVASGGSILLPPNSNFNIAAAGSFFSSVSVSIQVFDPVTSKNIGSGTTLGTSITGGSFLLAIDASGSVRKTGTGTISGGGSGTNVVNFSVSKSGDFNDPTIWAGGIVPSQDSLVSIPSGFTVTLSGSSFGIRIKQWDLAGTLSLGEGSASFTFSSPLKMIVRTGATVRDLTSGKRILLPSSSSITVLSGGTFAAAGTVVQVSNSGIAGSSIALSSGSGPFTCAVFASGSIQFYNKVTFIAAQSGGFTSGDTFLGGLAPSAELCAGSCDIQVEPGAELSTDDLNGILSFSVGSITVKSGGTLKLGTAGSSFGFKFASVIELSIAGIMSFVGSGGSILMAPGSRFSLTTGGSFSSIVSVSINSFNLGTGAIIGNGQNLGTSIIGGDYQLVIKTDGSFTITGKGPGSSDNNTTTQTMIYSTSLLG